MNNETNNITKLKTYTLFPPTFSGAANGVINSPKSIAFVNGTVKLNTKMNSLFSVAVLNMKNLCFYMDYIHLI
jgi:hypothetical protein